MLLEFLQVLVVCHLHLVYEVHDLCQILLVVQLIVNGILYASVQIDGQHALGTCRHASCSQCIAEAVVLYLVSQSAARAQRVSVVAHVGKEGVSFGIHLRREVSPFLVDNILAV